MAWSLGMVYLSHYQPELLLIYKPCIYIYNINIYIYVYPYIPIYLHMYTEYIYIYILYTYTHISTYDIYTIILFCFRPNPPGGSFAGTRVARCHGRSHKCAAPFRAVVREMLGLLWNRGMNRWAMKNTLVGLGNCTTWIILGYNLPRSRGSYQPSILRWDRRTWSSIMAQIESSKTIWYYL